MEKKDYSLLRPFDLEAAKRGEAICYFADCSPRIFIDGPDSLGKICVKNHCDGEFFLSHPNLYCMAPLAWVEGKPVYKGDALYDSHGKKVVKAADDLKGWLLSEDGITFKAECCTWTPPKVKREGWVNIYPARSSNAADTGNAHATREDADRQACSNRIACVRIEWEEPSC